MNRQEIEVFYDMLVVLVDQVDKKMFITEFLKFSKFDLRF